MTKRTESAVSIQGRRLTAAPAGPHGHPMIGRLDCGTSGWSAAVPPGPVV